MPAAALTARSLNTPKSMPGTVSPNSCFKGFTFYGN